MVRNFGWAILWVVVGCGSGGSGGGGGGGECAVHSDCPAAFPWCLGSGEDAICVECLEDRHCGGEVCSASDHTCRGGGDADTDTDTDTDSDSDTDTSSGTDTDTGECRDDPDSCLACAQDSDCGDELGACLDDAICACYVDCVNMGTEPPACVTNCGAEGNLQCNALWGCLCEMCDVCGYGC